jgi:O-antigen/teichoic acid export membrane protein
VNLARRFRALGRDTVLYGLSFGLSKSVGLLLLPVYTRYLVPEEFGLYDSAMVLAAVLNLVMQAELNGALTRYFYQAGEDRRPLISTIYAAVVLLGVLFGGLTWMIAPAIARLVTDSPDGPLTMRLVVLMAFGSALFSLAIVQLRLERRIGRYAAVSFINVAASGALGIVFVVAFGWGVPGAVGGTAAGAWLGAAVGTAWVRGALGGAFSPPLLRRALGYSLPMVPAVAAGYVRRFGDRLVILAFLPASALGIYAVGFKIAMIPGLLLEAFKLSWGPVAMALIGSPDQKTVYRHALRFYVLVVGTLGFGVAAFSTELLRVLGSPAYAGAEPVIGWVVAATVVSGAAGFVAVGALVAERSSVLAITNWVGAATSLGLMFLLVPVMGIEGAAVGAAGGAVVAIAGMYRMSQRLFMVPYDVGRICVVTGLYFLAQGTVLRWALDWPYPVSLRWRAATFLAFAGLSALLLLRRSEWTRAAAFLRARLWPRGLPGSV